MRLEQLTSAAVRDLQSRHTSAVEVGPLADGALHAVLLRDERLEGISSVVRSAFDSDLFGAPIFRVTHAAAVDAAAFELVHRLMLDGVRRAGARQLVRRIDAASFAELWTLQRLGFRIVDIGVTFRLAPSEQAPPDPPGGVEVGPATDRQIAQLLDTATSIFRTSHFYVDPFYPEEQANELHRRWLSNCHHGGLADVVLTSREGDVATGFVTCKVVAAAEGRRIGDIALVGVHRQHQGKRIGTALVAHALRWFASRCDDVHVRTQAINYGAVNLYEKCGFRLLASDITLSKGLEGDE
ncbi:MAG: GNAT family N-acetyltransferase [Myxococcales bacterium]|nr:GNAT family N-acetyltransferase [Myxococcales bacterium]